MRCFGLVHCAEAAGVITGLAIQATKLADFGQVAAFGQPAHLSTKCRRTSTNRSAAAFGQLWQQMGQMAAEIEPTWTDFDHTWVDFGQNLQTPAARRSTREAASNRPTSKMAMVH